jgi:cell division protein FtsN
VPNKDYVKRGQGTIRHKAKPQKGNKPAVNKPWKLGIFVILASVAMGFGLFKLSSDPAPTSASVITPEAPKPTASVAVKKQEQSALPPMPEEKWNYITSLPNKEVEIIVKDKTQDNSLYIMQCGAFKKHSQARERKANIAFQGLKSDVVNDEGSSWFRVVLGPYQSKRAAIRDQHKLQRVKIEPCAIWKKNN